ncbi:MAG: hypothetical protein ABSD98_07855 [Candidatus Korobacteraceae bacterium]|jgi:hypothetical protein
MELGSEATGFEAAGGIVEKFLPGVSFPVLMNTVLPGLLAGAALYPFATGRLRDFLSVDPAKGWPQLAIAALAVVVIGALVSALNGEFYKVYEGRSGWPTFLSEWAVARQQRRVDRLYRKADAEKGVNSQRYNEYWYTLRIYPIHPEKGKRYATHPTLLGNILAGYEEYPGNRYGMDSVFYWPRLWLMVDKDQKEEIGKSWAIADGILNLSAVSFLAGLFWLGAFTGAKLGLLRSRWFPVGDAFVESIAAVAGWFVLGYVLYRLSLPFQRKNGEIFKSLFDLYRDKLKKMTSLAPRESELWRAAWAYLQYLRIPCPNCGKGTISVITNDCSNADCGAHVPEAVADFRRSGKLVKLPKSDRIGEDFCDFISELAKAFGRSDE